MEAYLALRKILGIGTEPLQLTALQVVLRAIIVFVAAIAMVRLGDKRFLARLSAFDAVLGFILASMLARAVNGSAPFFSTLAAGFVLVGLHRLAGFTARHSHRFSVLVKGRSDVVIEDGKVIEPAMRGNDLSEQDLLEELRLEGKVESPQEVRKATMERNGRISVIPQRGT